MKSLTLIILVSFIISQSWDNHVELDWQYFETEHFVFYFHANINNYQLINSLVKLKENVN